jgi:uncharacterized protein
MPSDERVDSIQTLKDISRTSWNSLSGADSFYLSHEWLSFVEQEGTADVNYLLLRDSDELLGALPTYSVTSEPNRDYRLDTLFVGSHARRRPLIVGTRRAYVNEFLFGDRSAETQCLESLGNLLIAADRHAHECDLDELAFLYLSTPAAAMLRRLRPEMTPILIGMDARIPVPGSEFGDYLSALGSQRGHAVRKDLRRFEAAGYTTAIEPLSQCWYEAGPLVANVQQKYGHDDTAETCRHGLSAQASALDRHTLVFTLRDEGVLRGCALFYSWRKMLYGRVVGFDYERLANVGEYFYLYFYRPLQYAYENGYECLHLGRGSYSAKLRRGAVPRALWAMISPPAAAHGDWRQYNADILNRWKQDQPRLDIDVPVDWIR